MALMAATSVQRPARLRPSRGLAVIPVRRVRAITRRRPRTPADASTACSSPGSIGRQPRGRSSRIRARFAEGCAAVITTTRAISGRSRQPRPGVHLPLFAPKFVALSHAGLRTADKTGRRAALRTA
jgi:hypothetical protein